MSYKLTLRPQEFKIVSDIVYLSIKREKRKNKIGNIYKIFFKCRKLLNIKNKKNQKSKTFLHRNYF